MGSLYSYIGGVDATSNVLAGKLFNVPVVGTMGHSYITSFGSLAELEKFDTIVAGKCLKDLSLKYRKQLGFENTNEGELASFIAFAITFPDNLVCLVDSFNTLDSGVKNYICVALAVIEVGRKPRGIRLDSGDLCELALRSRSLFEEIEAQTGMPISKLSVIAASDGINEKKLRAYPKDNKIDVFGIGTNLITCESQPALGMVCKLVSLNDNPIIKLSDNIDKMTLPGKKSLFSASGAVGGVTFNFDIIGTEEDDDI